MSDGPSDEDTTDDDKCDMLEDILNTFREASKKRKEPDPEDDELLTFLLSSDPAGSLPTASPADTEDAGVAGLPALTAPLEDAAVPTIPVESESEEEGAPAAFPTEEELRRLRADGRIETSKLLGGRADTAVNEAAMVVHARIQAIGIAIFKIGITMDPIYRFRAATFNYVQTEGMTEMVLLLACLLYTSPSPRD